MTKEEELLEKLKELDFKVRCLKKFTEREAKQMLYVIYRLHILKALPMKTITELMAKNDARKFRYDREHYMEKSRGKKAGVVRPVQTRKQKVQARMAKRKSGYVTV